MANAYERFQKWLYLPDGYTGVLSCFTGLCTLLFAPVIWVWTHAGSGQAGCPMPYNAPAWKIGNFLLDVPLPAEPVNIVVFIAYLLVAMLLLLGKRYRWLYLFLLAITLFYCARDWLPACYHWIILPCCYLAALALQNKNGPSPTRRLIQITVVSCYLYGVLQKLTIADFWQGHTFASFFEKGWAVNGIFQPFFASLDLPLSFWAAFSCLVLAVETFIGIGLCYKKTRTAAVITGLLLHGGIAITMDFVIAIFTIVMWTGYIAFYDRRGDDRSLAVTDRPLQTILSAAFIALLLLFPLRIYLPGQPQNDVLTLFDRTPWAYTMFILRQNVDAVKVEVTDAEKRTVKPYGRMLNTSTVNDMVSLARWVIAANPHCTAVDVQSLITVNRHRYILKKCHWSKPANPAAYGDISAFSYSAENISPEQHRLLVGDFNALNQGLGK
jgi:hypothetical protein